MHEEEVTLIPELTMNEYQEGTHKTAIYSSKSCLTYLFTGLCAEAGEVAGKFAKCVRDGDGKITPEVRDAILWEVGDVMWFCSEISRVLQCDLSLVALRNLEKLQSRQERDVLRGEGDNR